MKSYNHLYEKTISETNRRYALSQAKHSKRFRKIMKHRHMSDDAAVEQSLDWIVNYENAEHVPVYIYDGITRKERTIIVPTMEELLVQHCIVNAMKPMFCNLNDNQYIPMNGDRIRFAMKNDYNDETPLLIKEIPIDTMILTLNPEDTKHLPFGKYVYDIELTKATGEVDTFITKAILKLTEEVH